VNNGARGDVVLPQLSKLQGIALDFLFPRYCVGCGREGDFICFSCLGTLAGLTPPLCPRCGRPLDGDAPCPDCRHWQPALDGIRSPFRFTGVLRRAVLEFKYHNLRALAGPLACLLRGYLEKEPLPADVLVPVPLHQSRLRERGYNQSLLLAKELGKLSGLPVIAGSLIRHRPTLPQAQTRSIGERRRNIAGAFACRDSRLKGKSALLIDDVATSGSTLDACAAALKAVGAVAVWGLVVAREV